MILPVIHMCQGNLSEIIRPYNIGNFTVSVSANNNLLGRILLKKELPMVLSPLSDI